MTVWPVLLLLAAASPPVEVSTLNGDQHVGSLEKLAADELVLKTPSGSTKLPAGELLAIRVPGVMPIPATESLIEVRLTDGTLLRVSAYQSTSAEAIATHPQLGEVKLPLTAVQSVRFAAPDSRVDPSWKQLLSRASRKDQIAVRKNDVLDHLDGVIGPIDAATIKFQLDGDDIPVKRERAFGLIYAKREATQGKTTATVELAGGDRLVARTVTWDSDAWKVKLVAGTELSVAASAVTTVDYSLGKIAYLSNLEPRDVKYTPYYDVEWTFRRDRSPPRSGAPPPVSFGAKTYAKSVSIHSKTMLRYRIGGDYRRFQAIMGIDEYFVCGNVDVVIKGDGKVLFQGPARAGQPPQTLDLDVAGIVELEITVDYGEDKVDIGDWLNLADAKLVK